WPVATSLAAFQHGGMQWLVFDKPSTFDSAALAGKSDIIEKVETVPHPDYTIIRLATKDHLAPSIHKIGKEWRLTFDRESEQPSVDSLSIKVAARAPGRANL